MGPIFWRITVQRGIGGETSASPRPPAARGEAEAAAGHRVVLPSDGAPLVEVCMAPGATAAEREMCLAYWEFTEPGAWVRHVAVIGEVREVVRVVKAHSQALVLTVECPRRGMPVAVATRSDFAETGLWHPGLFPRAPVAARSPRPRECG